MIHNTLDRTTPPGGIIVKQRDIRTANERIISHDEICRSAITKLFTTQLAITTRYAACGLKMVTKNYVSGRTYVSTTLHTYMHIHISNNQVIEQN